ncbi:hypothetical protein Salat_0579900 [Sesamum alatum]|uniref:DUF4283 domain-containing protein n=1 Tax=Sesamum alatum TaxID=300844 RepID=A0AAE1YQ68_9LAMI|nr:hypothetical protein Salat_0579900 [Sesamum alatum]
MDGDILRMGSMLSLREDEVTGVIIPETAWSRAEANYQLTLVGRLLSHRSGNFEALRNLLQNLIRPVRGMLCNMISEDRFCLVFNHQEDLRRALAMRPWTFDRNLILLQRVAPGEDPTTISLDWSPFFVNIHDLCYGQRSLDVVCYIGSSLGKWEDADCITPDVAWFEVVRIRVLLNATLPFKRALTLCSDTGAAAGV